MNKVVHFEIPTRNIKRADDFYEKVFGWKINRDVMLGSKVIYHLAYTSSVDKNYMPVGVGLINGALMAMDSIVKAPVLTIDVPDMKTHLKMIEDNGGKVLTPVQKVMNMGLYTRFKDTEGNVTALWQNLPKN